MKFPFIKNNRGYIGIAFNDNGVTVGQCEWSHGEFRNAKSKRIDIVPSELTADDWQSCISEIGLAGSVCTITLPPSMTHDQILRLPEMSGQELQKVASWELADRLGVDHASLHTDVVRLGVGGDVLAVAIDNEIIEWILDPIYKSGMRPSIVEPQCSAVARMFSMLHRRQSDKAQVRSVFDFGESESAYMILAGDCIVFYKHLTYNGNALIEAIETHTSVTRDQAKKMLYDSRLEGADPAIFKAVHDATRSICEEIAMDVMKCNRHYGVTSRGPLSSRIIITGSAGWNHHLSSVFSKNCNQEVVPDSSEPHVHVLPNEIVTTNGWHIALGASLAKITTVNQRRRSDPKYSEVA
jgi:Tfp pilus assembly PilM family ATPase